jgi:preprotein translocase subunit SecE
MKKIINYIKDSYNELVHKVSWPSRSELTNSAVIVMIASILMALVVWGVDSVFDRTVKLFYGLL